MRCQFHGFVFLIFLIFPCKEALSNQKISFEPAKTLLECEKRYSSFKRGFYDDLLPWQVSGINEDLATQLELRSALDGPRTNPTLGVTFVISNDQVLIRGSKTNLSQTFPWYAREYVIYAFVLEHLAKKFRNELPSKAIYLFITTDDTPTDHHDTPNTWKDPYLPLFRYSRTAASVGILIPDWPPYQYALSKEFLSHAYKNPKPWNKRARKMVMSGFAYHRADYDWRTQRYAENGTLAHSPRMYLGEFLAGANRSDIVVSEFIPMQEYGNFTMALHTDGIGFSSRLPKELSLGTLILRESSGYTSFWDRIIQPWVHYVPVYKFRAKEILWAVDWAQSHDEDAQRIANSGREAIKHYGTKDALDCYWLMLFHELARIQTFNPLERKLPIQPPYKEFQKFLTVDEFVATATKQSVGPYYITRDEIEFDDAAIFG